MVIYNTKLKLSVSLSVYYSNSFCLYLGVSHSQRISAMEKGQCPTVATWESGNVRSRKATTPATATTPGQVWKKLKFSVIHDSICHHFPCHLNVYKSIIDIADTISILLIQSKCMPICLVFHLNSLFSSFFSILNILFIAY